MTTLVGDLASFETEIRAIPTTLSAYEAELHQVENQIRWSVIGAVAFAAIALMLGLLAGLKFGSVSRQMFIATGVSSGIAAASSIAFITLGSTRKKLTKAVEEYKPEIYVQTIVDLQSNLGLGKEVVEVTEERLQPPSQEEYWGSLPIYQLIPMAFCGVSAARPVSREEKICQTAYAGFLQKLIGFRGNAEVLAYLQQLQASLEEFQRLMGTLKWFENGMTQETREEFASRIDFILKIVEFVRKDIPAEPLKSVLPENPASLESREKVTELFNEALQDLELSQFIVNKFFPKNCFQALEQKRDYYEIVLEAPKEIIGFVGQVNLPANTNLSEAQVFLGRTVKCKIKEGKILFLNQKGQEKTLKDHGTAHEMDFRLRLKGTSIIQTTGTARLVVKEEDHVVVAPISIQYSNNSLEMPLITDHIARFSALTNMFRDGINLPNKVWQSKEGFAQAFQNLRF